MVQQVEDKLTDTLKECSAIAKQVYKENMNFRHELEHLLIKLQHELRSKYHYLKIDPDAKNFDFSQSIESLITKINSQTNNGLSELTEALNEKKKHLNSFTLSLFGKSKAGKSTIREALTAGTGETIGKGAQRTTRDILEYEWNGLRLLDVPGIEAFKGEEDTEKAHEILDQSDMILFLTTDDSVQMGEYKEMSRLQDLNKHFIVVMNVKRSLMDAETGEPQRMELRRFLRKPESVFELDRLNEHHNQIQSNVKKYFNIDHVDVIYIHAQAAFLSTRKELTEFSEKLWETSRIDKVYDRIMEEINRIGKHRRVLTFYDSTINFVDTLEKMLWEEQNIIRAQALFMKEKKVELNRFFNRFIRENNEKIENKVRKFYVPLQQWAPLFVENFIGRNEADYVLKNKMNSHNKLVEDSMNDVMKEILADLQTYLSEFTRQYKYDAQAIYFEQTNIGDFRQRQLSKVMKWGGITTGAISTAVFIGTANVWNPIGWAFFGVSAVAGISSGFMKNHESRKVKKAKREVKQNLYNHIKSLESKTIRNYQSYFDKNISKKIKKEIIDQVTGYIGDLFFISDQLKEKAIELASLKEKLNQHLFTHLLQLQGLTCQPNDMKSIAREQGVSTKLVVPQAWYVDGLTKTGLDEICGEHITLISEDSDLKGLVAKALYPAKINSNQVEIVEDRMKKIVQVNIPDSKKGLAIGKNGVNIRLAQELCKVKIELI